MKNNKNAFSLVIVMWLVLITSLLAITIIDYMIPFSKSVVWMENSSKAYYLANSWIEDWIYNLKKEWENDRTKIIEKNYLSNNFSDYVTEQESKDSIRSVAREIIFEWSQEPQIWKWESEFAKLFNSSDDRDYNSIFTWNPIQMDVWKLSSWISSLKIIFKVPKINWQNLSIKESINPYIWWQLSSEDGFITSKKDTSIEKDKINTEILVWRDLLGDVVKTSSWWTVSLIENISLERAYEELSCRSKSCILKFSVINELKATWNWQDVSIPYLEWKITNDWKKFLYRYADISAEWKSSGYTRTLEVKIPQVTVNEAFDFTVYQ